MATECKDVQQGCYIVSLPHSGSTILGYILSEHPSVVFLGEIDYGLAKLRGAHGSAEKLFCSCGSRADECLFWGLMSGEIARDQSTNGRDAVFFENFRQAFGNGMVFVDSNKTVEPGARLANNPSLRISCISSIRDFRGAAVSEAIRKKIKQPSRPMWITSVQLTFQWVRKNTALHASIPKIPFHAIHRTSYEKICFNPAREIESIWRFLGLEKYEYRGDPNRQKAHVLAGNKLSSSAGLRSPTYDERWRHTRAWWPSVILFPILPMLNRRWVYS